MYQNYLFVKHSTAVISAVTGAVDLLGKQDMETLVSVLKDLGARHADYNLEQAHYDLVGEALISTLGKALSDSFTSEVKDSWCTVYKIIAEKMMLGAKEHNG